MRELDQEILLIVKKYSKCVDVGISQTLESIGVDSLTTIKIIIEIEQKLSIEIPDSVFFAGKDTKIGDIVDYLKSKLNIIDVTPIHKKYANCLEDSLISILNYWKIEHLPLFFNSFRAANWSDETKELLSDIPPLDRIIPNISSMFNLSINILKDKRIFSSTISQALKEKNPVIVQVDMHDLPWSEYYKKIHEKHFLIIVGENQNTYYTVDPTLERKGLSLEKEKISFEKLVLLKKKDELKNFNVDYKNMEKDIYVCLNDEMKTVSEIQVDEKIQKELTSYYSIPENLIEFSPFFRYLLWISKSRKSFAEVLTLFNKKYENSILNFRAISEKWLSIRMFLLKCILKQNIEDKLLEFQDKYNALIKEEMLYIKELISCMEIETQQTILSIQESASAKEKLLLSEVEYWKSWPSEVQKINQQVGNIIYFNGDTQKNEIFLSFDDAPDATYTNLILDVLAENDVKAMFAVMGEHVIGKEEILKRIYDEGHLIINHSQSHPYYSEVEVSDVISEIETSNEIIKKVIGKTPLIIRPPHGNITEDIVSTLKDEQFVTVLWSWNTYDWRATQKEDILTGMIDQVRNGEIILLHSYTNKQPTVDAITDLIPMLKENGFVFGEFHKNRNIAAYKEDLVK
ncbi:polysaccharide deacetylase family protein [Bacillus pacificus]|uniref:polysaccharide deacetylase family protein n=1 Tax=Bacillus pacificus TaxID=2026187 RepID=UPI003D1EB477